MRKIIVLPSVFVVCSIVIGISSVAAAQMPIEAPPGFSEIQPELKSEAPLAEGYASETTTFIDNNCSLPTSYPESIQQWCEEIENAAEASGLPANLIAAVVLQESGGDPQAYSSSGAVGLMQIMPRDGLAAEFMCINGPCFSSRPAIAELEDPNFNLAYGSRMLAGLTAKYESYREALFRYGPMDVGYYYADLVLKIWENYQ